MFIFGVEFKIYFSFVRRPSSYMDLTLVVEGVEVSVVDEKV